MRCDKCSTSTEDVVHTYEQVHHRQARIAELELKITGLEDDILQGQARIVELEGALRWLVHLGHDVGKAGGRPEPGEWKHALDQGRKVLEES